MISIKGIKKSFDKLVLDDLNLDIEDGTIFGLVGINGAGKSTLLKIMAGIMKPEEGLVYYDYKPIYENIEVKKDVFLLPDDPFYSRNTTPKNLIVNKFKLRVVVRISLGSYFINVFIELPVNYLLLFFK